MQPNPLLYQNRLIGIQGMGMITRIFIAVAVGISLAGCNAQPFPNESRPDKLADSYIDLPRPKVWTDIETGCQYLIVKVKEGFTITPRLGVDTRPICKKT